MLLRIGAQYTFDERMNEWLNEWWMKREPVVLKNLVRCSIEFFNSFLPPFLHYLITGLVLGLFTGTALFWVPISFCPRPASGTTPLTASLTAAWGKGFRYYSRPAALGTCKDTVSPLRGSLPKILACPITTPRGNTFGICQIPATGARKAVAEHQGDGLGCCVSVIHASWCTQL